MLVDSFRFLPRSFRPMFEAVDRLPGEDEPVWAPFDGRLADARITLLTSAGLYLTTDQAPFDVERERREPEWGDPSWRRIPQQVETAALDMTHLHVKSADVLTDHDVALPTRTLAELVDEGCVGGVTDEHVSVMGYQQADLAGWREETGPEIVDFLRDQRCDGVVLAPV